MRRGRGDRRGRRVADPRIDRLPHAFGLRRQPRRRDRNAAARHRLRRNCPAGRWNPRHGSRYACAWTNRAAGGRAAAAAGLGGRRRNDGRDQVGLWADAARRVENASRRRGAGRACARSGRHDALGRPCLAAGICRAGRRLYRARLHRDHPAAAAEKLADAVDVFCECIAFSPANAAACSRRPSVKGWRSRATWSSFPTSAARNVRPAFAPLSLDHLEHLDEPGVRAIAAAGTVAVLLPGAFYFLRRDAETAGRAGSARRACRWPWPAISNPGTSPLASLRLAMNMACTLFGLSPEEALRGVTRRPLRPWGWPTAWARWRLEGGPIFSSGTSTILPS